MSVTNEWSHIFHKSEKCYSVSNRLDNKYYINHTTISNWAHTKTKNRHLLFNKYCWTEFCEISYGYRANGRNPTFIL